MTRDEMERQVAQLLLEQRRLARFNLKLSPDSLLLLQRLLYRLGLTRAVPMSRHYGRAPASDVLAFFEGGAQGGTFDPNNHSDMIFADKLADHEDPREFYVRQDLKLRNMGVSFPRAVDDRQTLLNGGSDARMLGNGATYSFDDGTRLLTSPYGKKGLAPTSYYHEWRTDNGNHSYAAVLTPEEHAEMMDKLFPDDAAEDATPHIEEPTQQSRRSSLRRYGSDLYETKPGHPAARRTSEPGVSSHPKSSPPAHDAIAEDLLTFRQQVRPKHVMGGENTVAPNSPEERALLAKHAMTRGLRVRKSNYTYYDDAAHTLYHPTPDDHAAVGEAYVKMGGGRVRLNRKSQANAIYTAVARRLARKGLVPNDPQMIRYTQEGETTPPTPSEQPSSPTPEQPQPEPDPAEPPEWDGSIEEDEVVPHRGWYTRNSSSFSNWDSDTGEEYPQSVHIQSGDYTPPGHEDPVDVFRWVHVNNGGEQNAGEWHADSDHVATQAEEYANSNNEDAPEPTDSVLDNLSLSPDDSEGYADYHRDGEDHSVNIDSANFEFAGSDYTAYRWSDPHGDEVGEWTMSRRDARRGADERASDMHEEPTENSIHEYSYKPDVEPLGEKGPHYGVELETQLKQSSPLPFEQAAQQTLDTLNAGYPPEAFAYLKEDSSIEAGSPHRGKGTFEIVTHPATMEVHKKQWTPFFTSPPQGLISHDANAGLHIHVGRNNLTSLGIGKIVYFVNHPNNKDFLTKLARRESPRWAALSPKKPSEIKGGGSRYVAVNLEPRNTIEFRLFRGTLKPESFFASLEFVDALTNLARSGKAGVSEMETPDALFNYVVANHKSYPNLLNFIEKYAGRPLVKRGPRKMQLRPSTPLVRVAVPMSVRVRFFSNRSTSPTPPRARFTRRVVRFAKADTRHEAHPLIAGFAIEHALRHMANDASRSDAVRELSKRALTTGDTSALWGLHDAVQEDGKGVPGGYNLMSAADKIHLDAKTKVALDAESARSKAGIPPEHHGSHTYSPEHHAERAERALAKRRGYRNDHFLAEDRALLDRLRQHVAASAPGTLIKLIDESIRRHAHRGWRIAGEQHYGNNSLFTKIDHEQALKDLKDVSADDSDHAKTIVSTRYRRKRAVVHYAKPNRSNFIDALRRIQSSNHTALTDAARDVANRMGVGETKIYPALHDTPHGSAPGVAQAVYSDARPETVHALAAWVNGLLPNGPGYAVFHARPNGPDTLYRIRHDGSGMDVRVRLDRAGIVSRVMIPHRKGFDVIIPDKGNKLAANVQAYAQQHGLQVEASPGYFQTVGSADQAQARDTFRNKVVQGERSQLARKRYALVPERPTPKPLERPPAEKPETIDDFKLPVYYESPSGNYAAKHYVPTKVGGRWAWQAKEHLGQFPSEAQIKEKYPHAVHEDEFFGRPGRTGETGSEWWLTPEEVWIATEGREGKEPLSEEQRKEGPEHRVATDPTTGERHGDYFPEDFYAMRRNTSRRRYAKVPASEEGMLTPEQLAIAKRAIETGDVMAWGALGDNLQENGFPNTGGMLARVGRQEPGIARGGASYGSHFQHGNFRYRVFRDGPDLVHHVEVAADPQHEVTPRMSATRFFQWRERPQSTSEKLSRRRYVSCPS